MENERLNKISRFLAIEKVLLSGSAGAQAILSGLQSSSSSESSTNSDDSEREETNEKDEKNRTTVRSENRNNTDFYPAKDCHTSSTSQSFQECVTLQQQQQCENFCEIIESYSDMEFKSNMRIGRSTAEFLIERYKVSVGPRERSSGRVPVPPWKKFHIYIWYVSNIITFRQLSNLFGVSPSTAWQSVNEISTWLISIGDECIKWPSGTVATDVINKFEERSGIPGVIGAIGCIYIPIKAPKINKENYIDRNQRYSLVLQAVVDGEKRFTDITCGEPGSQHARIVLWRSKLFSAVQTQQQNLFPNDSFLLGDSAYPLTSWLVPPFKDNGKLNESQRKFNELHFSTYIVAENAFGLLKARFRRLMHFNETGNMNFIVNIIVSTCVLHNICIPFKDDMDIEIVQNEDSEHSFDEEFLEENDEQSENRRSILFEYLEKHNLL